MFDLPKYTKASAFCPSVVVLTASNDFPFCSLTASLLQMATKRYNKHHYGLSIYIPLIKHQHLDYF